MSEAKADHKPATRVDWEAIRARRESLSPDENQRRRLIAGGKTGHPRVAWRYEPIDSPPALAGWTPIGIRRATHYTPAGKPFEFREREFAREVLDA